MQIARAFVRHKTGSKANQDEILDFTASNEILIGRDRASCGLAYDENADETVSRKHARIVRDAADPTRFTIENFSRNGTFVDGRKIDAPTPLQHGSLVRFGASGPSFIFEIDPPPRTVKPTVLDIDPQPAATGAGQPEPWWARKATLTDSSSTIDSGSGIQWHPAKILLICSIAILVIAVVASAMVFFNRPKDSNSLVQADGGAVVSIDATWRLIDPVSGRQAYHWYVPNPNSPKERIPVFVRIDDNAVEPVLILNDERDTNHAIAGQVTGSGCVVNENGFILTGGSVAAPFNETFDWSRESPPLLLIDLRDRSVTTMNDFPSAWKPSASRFVVTPRTTVDDVKMGRAESPAKRLDGKLDSITIGLSGSANRINAKLVAMSPGNRIALLKIDPVRPLRAATIEDAKSRPAVADRVYVFGYGADPLTANNVAVRLASVTKSGSGLAAGGFCPECYQVSDSGAGPGFDGAPVFDDRGKLAGVFQLESGAKSRIFSVVPVEQAADLLGQSHK